MKIASEIADFQAIAATYELYNGIFLLGNLSSGVTVYRQQVRAHNLAGALSLLARQGIRPLGKTAIVGGGIAGLTVAAGLLSTVPDIELTLFEKRWDLCPFQQGSDSRWLHPSIYDWPAEGTRSPSANLPVLDWQQGRAADVARTILNRFADYCAHVRKSPEVYLGLHHLSITASTRKLEWMGRLGNLSGRHFHVGPPAGDTREFDTIILATGFGLETDRTRHGVPYWRNDALAQPALSGKREQYVVSGFGDGAIVDLCRLTIERFRQDRILEELLEQDLERLEDLLRPILDFKGGRISRNAKQLLDATDGELATIVGKATERMSKRLRKDTSVLLHARGTETPNGSIDLIFENHSSFLNRFLLYLLYKTGAFTVSFDELPAVLEELEVPDDRVVRRYGTDSQKLIQGLFSDFGTLQSRVNDIKKSNAQSTNRLWPLGHFPYVPEGLGL